VTAGLLLALLAAVLFGVVDLTAARVSRAIGTGLTLAALMGISVAVLIPIVALMEPTAPLEANLVSFLALGGAFAVAYLALIQALRLGPISVVGPITSSIGAATALLAILVIGDRPTSWQLLGIGTAAAGSVLAGLTPATGGRGFALAGPGVLFAVINVFAAAVVVLSLQQVTSSQWAAPILLLRGFAGLWLLIAAVPARWRPPAGLTDLPDKRKWALAAVAIAVLDTLGMAALSISFRTTPAWLVGLLAGISPAIVTIGGVALLGERIGSRQAAGLALLGVSLTVLALTG
jgi:drug/metabolite transporter (DMT)-like permease